MTKTTGRFWVEIKTYDDGNLYRARGPLGMIGDWHEEELDCQPDLLHMMQQVKLSDAENEIALAIYETIHNL